MVFILHPETLCFLGKRKTLRPLWKICCPVAHSPIMMPENARTRAATRAEVTTERINESGRWGSGVGDTGRQVPMGH